MLKTLQLFAESSVAEGEAARAGTEADNAINARAVNATARDINFVMIFPFSIDEDFSEVVDTMGSIRKAISP
jgi:hypothetical protein